MRIIINIFFYQHTGKCSRQGRAVPLVTRGDVDRLIHLTNILNLFYETDHSQVNTLPKNLPDQKKDK